METPQDAAQMEAQVQRMRVPEHIAEFLKHVLSG